MTKNMKTTKLILLAVLPMVISGCNTTKKPTKSSEPTHFECDVSVHMTAMVNENKKSSGYSISTRYIEDSFNNPATTYSDDIKMMSFASSLVTESKDSAQEFFNTLGYERAADGGFDAITEDSVGYYIAHKTINDYEMLAISIRGFNYGKEWANNFKIGAEGNHAGFELRTNEIFDVLKPIIKSYDGKNLKLWAAGYSRGGAIANVLASKLLTSEEISVSKDNLYVYTFEAPACLSEANAVAYENVFNFVNPIDLVANVPPVAYGLKRCGIDKVIDYSNVDKKLKAFDSGAVLPAFTPRTPSFDGDASYNNEQELLDFIINTLLKDTNDPVTTLHTREKFAENYQEAIGYVVALFITLPQATIDKIIAKLKTLGALDFFALLSDDGLYNFLKPILIEDGIPFVDEELKTNLGKLNTLIQAKTSILMPFISTSPMGIDEAAKNSLLRIIYMHSPETVYALLK